MGKPPSRLKQLRRYPSLAIGLVLIAMLVGISLYAVVAIPYPEAVRLWRAGPGVWDENPKDAQPIWWDWFTRERLSRSIIVTSQDDGIVRVEPLDDDRELFEVVLPFSYDYDAFPIELTLFTRATGREERTLISVSWETPTGDTTVLGEYHARQSHTYYISQDRDLRDRLGIAPHRGLFAHPHDAGRMLKGDYRLVLRAEVPRDAEVEARLVVYGQVHGPFGTDHMRRDLKVALVWGAVEGLKFGVLAALAWQVGAVIVAAKGRRRRERTDPLLWRLTDVNMVLLSLPLLIAVGYFVSPSRGVMLLALLVSSLLIALIRVLRERLVPLGRAPDTGPAPGSRTMLALLLPSFLLLIPAFVFLDAALYILNLAGDPLLPSWGNLLNHALQENAIYHGHYYEVVQPMVLLLITALGFAMAGYALHRIYNPGIKTKR
ncbi:MAG: ABC transporter permease [Dehalococcoidia bacterium]